MIHGHRLVRTGICRCIRFCRRLWLDGALCTVVVLTQHAGITGDTEGERDRSLEKPFSGQDNLIVSGFLYCPPHSGI